MKHISNFKKIYILFIFLILILLPMVEVLGSEEYKLLAPIPMTPGGEPEESVNFDNYIKGIYNLAIGIAIILAVIAITIGGLQYITTPSESGKSKAKETIYMALFGLLIALASWLIITTILGESVFV